VKTLTLLSVGGPTSTTVADDAAYIQKNYLDDLNFQGREVVVVMHSYRGTPGTESVKGRTRRDIAVQGKKGGVVALVYMAAFVGGGDLPVSYRAEFIIDDAKNGSAVALSA
jgi:hypothetical protein